MKAIRARQYLYDDSTLDETEFALAISPCPQIDGGQAVANLAQTGHERSALDRHPQIPSARQTAVHDNDLTETLTMGWALALALAVALTVYLSGG